MRFRKVIPCTFRQSTFPLEKKISVKNNEFILGDISKIKKLSLKTVTYPHGDIDISSCGDKYDILTTQNDDIIF